VNPYHQLLGLPEHVTAPDHYALLGVPRFTEDGNAIHAAAVARNTQIRIWQNSDQHRLADMLLDQIANAAITLEDPVTKAAYDALLREQEQLPATTNRGAENTGGASHPAASNSPPLSLWSVLIAGAIFALLLIAVFQPGARRNQVTTSSDRPSSNPNEESIEGADSLSMEMDDKQSEDPPATGSVSTDPKWQWDAALITQMERRLLPSLVFVQTKEKGRRPLGIVTTLGVCTIMPGSNVAAELSTLDGERKFVGTVTSRGPFPFCWLESKDLDLPPIQIGDEKACKQPQDVFVIANFRNAQLYPGEITAGGRLTMPSEAVTNRSDFVIIGIVFATDGSCLGIATRSKRSQPIVIHPLRKR
jgi:hypothetical protein